MKIEISAVEEKKLPPDVRIFRISKYGDIYIIYVEFNEPKYFNVMAAGVNDNGELYFVILPMRDDELKYSVAELMGIPEREEEKLPSGVILTSWFRYGFTGVLIPDEVYVDLLTNDDHFMVNYVNDT